MLNEIRDQCKNTANADLEPSIDRVGRQPGFFRANLPLVEDLCNIIRDSSEGKVAAPTSF